MVDLSQNVRNAALRRRSYPSSTRILTCFPFSKLQLGFTLGPANPQLTIQQIETENLVDIGIIELFRTYVVPLDQLLSFIAEEP